MHSGFVSILGRPNAGKSTLLNAVVGTKIAIVTDKPQTTRNRIQGVLNRPDAQVIFVDTPGLHKPDTLFNQRMMAEVRESLKGCDLLLLVVDATKAYGSGDEYALEMVRRVKIPCILVLNKIDLLPAKEELLPRINFYRGLHAFREIIPISATLRDGLDELVGSIVQALPNGPQYFPPEHVTDQPARFLVAELIREKIINLTRQELPYASMVLIDRFEETRPRPSRPGRVPDQAEGLGTLPQLLRIHATVFVERPGQKAILIGTRGDMMKKIGTKAREEIEKRFGVKVYLELFVKVHPGWRENEQFLRGTDWRSMVGESEDESEGPVVFES